MLGLGYFWDVHVIWYYIFTQIVFGIFQATGWPSVVAVVGKWVHRSRYALAVTGWRHSQRSRCFFAAPLSPLAAHTNTALSLRPAAVAS